MDERSVAALAERQRGYVTRRQLLELGISSTAIVRRQASGRLIAVYAGVYAVGHLPTLPQDRAAGALLACGPGAVLSHGSAAAAWGIFKSWELPFEVTAPSARRREGIRVHRGALHRRDVQIQLGLRTTGAARTLFDLAPRMSKAAITRAVNDLRRPGYLSLADLDELLKRHPRAPGTARLAPHVEASGGPTRSEFEDAFLEFVTRFDLPQPQVNVRVGGYEVDAWFPEYRVIVELDGYAFHSARDRFEADRERDAALLALGLVTVRITWERLIHFPEREAARLRSILEGRRFLPSSQTRLTSWIT